MSRTEDPTPVKCLDCGWEGRVMDCVHTYIACPNGDVEPVGRCPECGSLDIDNLADIEAARIDATYERVREQGIPLKKQEVMSDKADAGSARAEDV